MGRGDMPKCWRCGRYMYPSMGRHVCPAAVPEPLEEMDVNELLEVSGPFQPGLFYDPRADCIRCMLVDEPHVGEYIDKHLTVYKGRVSNEVIGFIIEGVKTLTTRSK